MRIGFGYDSHRIVENRDMILGGVKIPFEKGFLGHSDADVLTHAVIDAIFGAEAKGDIPAFSFEGKSSLAPAVKAAKPRF